MIKKIKQKNLMVKKSWIVYFTFQDEKISVILWRVGDCDYVSSSVVKS